MDHGDAARSEYAVTPKPRLLLGDSRSRGGKLGECVKHLRIRVVYSDGLRSSCYNRDGYICYTTHCIYSIDSNRLGSQTIGAPS